MACGWLLADAAGKTFYDEAESEKFFPAISLAPRLPVYLAYLFQGSRLNREAGSRGGGAEEPPLFGSGKKMPSKRKLYNGWVNWQPSVHFLQRGLASTAVANFVEISCLLSWPLKPRFSPSR